MNKEIFKNLIQKQSYAWLLLRVLDFLIETDEKEVSFVMCRSFENILLNNFQVIIFERMAKNCFKVNILSKKYAEIYIFQYKNNNIFLSKYTSFTL